MRRLTGPKIDWLSEAAQDKLGDEQGQRFLAWLNHLEANYHDIYGDYGDPSWIDTIAPYLAKEYANGNIEPNRHPAGGQPDPNVHKGDFVSSRLYPQDSLQEKIPKWAELLLSRKAPRNYMQRNYHPGYMEAARQDWDDDYSDEPFEVYDQDTLQDFTEARNRRQKELENPIKDRQHIPPITPAYQWPSLVEDAIGTRYGADPEAIDALYEHARENGHIPELAKEFTTQADRYQERANEDFNYYEPPSAEDMGFDPEPNEAENPEAWNEWQRQYEEALQEDQDERMRELRQDNPVYRNIDSMYEHLNPHYDPFHGEHTNEGPVQKSIEGMEPTRVPAQPVEPNGSAPVIIPPEQGQLLHQRPPARNRWPDDLPQFSHEQLDRINQIRRERGYHRDFHAGGGGVNRMRSHLQLLNDLYIPPDERDPDGFPLNATPEVRTQYERVLGGMPRNRALKWQMVDAVGQPAIPAGQGGEDPWVYNQEVQASVRKGKVATNPLYYRWSLNPTTGEANLNHNQEGHPAYIKTHSDLGAPEDFHGYAYRIDGGWRLTDYAHRPVEDPYVVAQVVRALNGEDGLRMASSGWERVSEDWDRLHYGLPI